MAQPLCIYHAHCTDGMAAAWAVWKRFGDRFEYVSANYGDKPPGVRGRDVVIVDFSYPAETVAQLAAEASSLLILDHHKTAQEALAALPPPPPGSYRPEVLRAWGEERNIGAPAYAIFDMNRSGAGIAWDYFHDGASRPVLIHYVEDRDLWKWALPYSREVSAYMQSFNLNFDNLSGLDDELCGHFDHVVSHGNTVLVHHDKAVQETVQIAMRRLSVGGVTIWAAPAPKHMASDVAGELAKLGPFGVAYQDLPSGRTFSLRSAEGGADVSEIAKRYGGGGHARAAGFKLSYDQIASDGTLRQQ